MDFARTSHTFDMNEYFSGQRFDVGGRDYEKEDREEMEALRALENNSETEALKVRLTYHATQN